MAHVLSVQNAKPDKLFYVVANILIINRRDQTCLLLKRSENEQHNSYDCIEGVR